MVLFDALPRAARDDHTVVLASEVAGSHALLCENRTVEVICADCEEPTPLKGVVICACGAIVTSKGKLSTVARRIQHDCSTRDEIARAVAVRIILSLKFFPFTLLIDANGRAIAPVHIAPAISLMHYGVLPLLPNVSEQDMVFLKRNGSLCIQMFTIAASALRCSENATHRFPPAHSAPSQLLTTPADHAHFAMATAALRQNSFHGRCLVLEV